MVYGIVLTTLHSLLSFTFKTFKSKCFFRDDILGFFFIKLIHNHVLIRIVITGWWLTYPSEKYYANIKKMFQTTNQIIVIITIIIIISTNCARLLERIPQQKINNQIRSMSKKQTSINNKNITLKTNSFPSQKLPKSLPLR